MSSTRLQQADPANIDALASHGQVVAARVGVAGGDGGDHLWERDVELQQLARIHLRDILRVLPPNPATSMMPETCLISRVTSQSWVAFSSLRLYAGPSRR